MYHEELGSSSEVELSDEIKGKALALVAPLQGGVPSAKDAFASRLKRRLEHPCARRVVQSVNAHLYLVLRSDASALKRKDRENSEVAVSDTVRSYKCSRRAAVMHAANDAFKGGIL